MTAWTEALTWQRGLALAAPVSEHHWRAVGELWPLVEPYQPATALEIGAGEPPYLTARMLRDHGVQVTTLDGLSACDVPGDVHDLPFAGRSFDLVVARHVLEHALCPYVVLREMARVSRGPLLVVVPYPGPKALNWPDHLWYLTKPGWELIFRQLHLTMAKVTTGDHTEDYARARGLWQDLELRYLLERE